MMKYTVNERDIEAVIELLGGEARVKNIQDLILSEFCMGKLPNNFSSERSFRNTVQRIIENNCPQAADFNPVNFPSLFLRVQRGHYRNIRSQPITLECGELDSPKGFNEGRLRKIYVSAYERNPRARAACIKIHGCLCMVCGMNFREKYGILGEGYIHVHHVKPISYVGENYVVNPESDLVPVCPNCHAMLHRQEPPLSVVELKRMINQY